MQLHLFGAATPSGEAFRQLTRSTHQGWQRPAYTRQPADQLGNVHWADFSHPADFRPAGVPGGPAIWVSFGPIWLLAPFLEQLAAHHPERLSGLCGLIACSSSSALTKRFAANHVDRELAARLIGAEELLLTTSRDLQVPCRILRPTLIYGQVGPYGDRNLCRLLQLMRRLPLLPLPSETGLRQPIHAVQLASVALTLADQVAHSGVDGAASEPHAMPELITLGGDERLSYTAMIKALQMALPPGDPARRCRFVPIPNRLFFSLAAPLQLCSPKAFEAVLRMGADLAGFTPSHQLLGQPAQPFPVLPLA